MRFLIDAQLPPDLCRWLEARGHQADHVLHLGLISATDAQVAARAESDSAVLVSKDADSLMLHRPDRFPFLWLRCGNVTNRALAAWLEERWERIEEMLTAGEGLIELQ